MYMIFRIPKTILIFAENDALDLTHIHTLRKILIFNLVYWSGNFVVQHSFRCVSAETAEILRKLCISTKFPHHEIR